MTPAEFKEKHGAAFKIFTRTACFAAFLQTLRDAHPMHRLRERKDGDKLHGAAMFLAQIDGYQQSVDTIEQLASEAPITPPEPESTYSESES